MGKQQLAYAIVAVKSCLLQKGVAVLTLKLGADALLNQLLDHRNIHVSIRNIDPLPLKTGVPYVRFDLVQVGSQLCPPA